MPDPIDWKKMNKINRDNYIDYLKKIWFGIKNYNENGPIKMLREIFQDIKVAPFGKKLINLFIVLPLWLVNMLLLIALIGGTIILIGYSCYRILLNSSF